jgi:hypothetical protein
MGSAASARQLFGYQHSRIKRQMVDGSRLISPDIMFTA